MMPDANQVCIAAAPSPSILMPYHFEFRQKNCRNDIYIP
jgi:hypothetical protein